MNMMNKKRSRGTLRAKYLIILPLITFLLLLSNIESVTHAAVNHPDRESVFGEVAFLYAGQEAQDLESSQTGQATIENPSKTKGRGIEQSAIAYAQQKKAKEAVYTKVDEMPVFPGGETALMDYIQTNLKYPAESAEKGKQGRVTVGFIVQKDGSISGIEVLRGIDQLCDAEAVRVIASMPRWQAGKKNGKAVATYFKLPVIYRLGKAKKKCI